MKQTAHLYYWFRVTTVLYQLVCVVLCPENVVKFKKKICPEIFFTVPRPEVTYLPLPVFLKDNSKSCGQILIKVLDVWNM